MYILYVYNSEQDQLTDLIQMFQKNLNFAVCINKAIVFCTRMCKKSVDTLFNTTGRTHKREVKRI